MAQNDAVADGIPHAGLRVPKAVRKSKCDLAVAQRRRWTFFIDDARRRSRFLGGVSLTSFFSSVIGQPLQIFTRTAAGSLVTSVLQNCLSTLQRPQHRI